MATRIYLPSSGAAPVTPSTWNFANQINPLTFAGSLTKTSSAMTTKLEATGTTNPTARAMLRYVIGPLEAQSISGTVKGQMRGLESNAGANASLALAIKIIQPGGADRAVLLAQTAGDSAAAGVELATGSLTNARFLNASEANPTLTTQTATRGDYLVIEIGFRSATATSRDISLRYGDTGGTDLTDGNTSETTDLVPWIEFSGDLKFIDRIPGAASTILGGCTPNRVMNHIAAVGVCALALAGASLGVSFQGPETGALTFAGQPPAIVEGGSSNNDIAVPAGSLALSGLQSSLVREFLPGAGALNLASQALTVSVGIGRATPAGALSLQGQAPTVVEAAGGTTLAIPAGALSLSGTNAGVAFTGPNTGALVLAGQAPTVSVGSGSSPTIAVPVGALTLSGTNVAVMFSGAGTGTLALSGAAPTLSISGGSLAIVVPVGALTLEGQVPTVSVAIAGAIAVPVGSLTLTGNNLSIAFIDPPPGALVLNGLAPTVAIGGAGNTTIAVPAGALTLAGQLPTLQRTYLASPPAGALTLNGLAPTLKTDVARAVPVGALALAGQAPTASVGIARAVPAGALTLSGTAPALNGPAQSQPGTGSLALSGTTPTLKTDLVVAVGVGALSLTGHAPSVAEATPGTFNPAWAIQANQAVVSYRGDFE